MSNSGERGLVLGYWTRKGDERLPDVAGKMVREVDFVEEGGGCGFVGGVDGKV